MESYRQFCPLSKAAELLCERWTPLILRELLLGSTRFNELMRGAPGISPSLLSSRLRALEQAGIVAATREGRTPVYRLTPAGLELDPLLTGMAEWGHRWARTDYRDDDLDPTFLMMDIRRNIRGRRLATCERVVVEFVFTHAGTARGTYWLVVEPGGEPDLCYLFPGYDVDVRIDCELRALTMVWMGDLTWQEALRTNLIRVSGPRRLSRQVPKWIARHELARIRRAEPVT